MANKYNIIITAQDAATARIRAVKRSLTELIRPITDTGKSAAALGKETGVDKIGASLAGGAKNAALMLRNVGGIGGALAGAIGAGSISALGVWSKNWANTNSQIMRTSATIGVAAQKIQTLEGAGKLAGLDPGSFTAGLDALGTTLNDAKWGQNQEALLLMNRMGIRMKTLKNGAIDSVGALEDLADVISKMRAPVQTKALVARTFGVEQLLPVLLKGRQAIRDYEADAAKLKAPLTDEQLRQADEYRKRIDGLGLSFEHLGDSIMFRAMPALGAIGDWISRHNNQAAKNIEQKGFWGALATGTAKYTTDVVKLLGEAATFNFAPNTASRTLGSVISKGEGDYDSVNLGRAGNNKSARRPLESMTVRQVMDAQASRQFNAAGKYQLIPSTLAGAVKALHMDPEKTNFDRDTQERIFNDYLLKIKRPEIGRYIGGQSDDLHGALKAAAREWASLADPDTGRSVYAGDGVNKASVPAVDVAKALMKARGMNPWTRAEVRDWAPPGSFQEGPQGGQQGAGGVPAAFGRPLGGQPAPLALPGRQAGSQGPDSRSAVQGGPAAAGAADGAAGPSAAGLADLWKSAPKLGGGETVVRLEIPNAPAGTKAEVVSSKGPVRTELKVEHSMPDYSL